MVKVLVYICAALKMPELACVPDHTSAECEALKILRALQAAAFKQINPV